MGKRVYERFETFDDYKVNLGYVNGSKNRSEEKEGDVDDQSSRTLSCPTSPQTAR